MENNVSNIHKLPRMIKLKQATEETGLSYHYLRKLCINGTLLHVRSGRCYYINADSLYDFLNDGNHAS